MDESVSGWMERVVTGDQEAARRIFEHYRDSLLRLARRRLANAPRRVADEEDVVLAAMNSYFRGAAAERFPDLEGRDQLWRLLATLTARKAVDLIQEQLRLKRGGGETRGDSIFSGPGDGLEGAAVDDQLSPDLAAELIEQLDWLLDQLGDQRLREVALAKLDGETNAAIAERLGMGLRSVERKLELIRSIWRELEGHE